MLAEAVAARMAAGSISPVGLVVGRRSWQPDDEATHGPSRSSVCRSSSLSVGHCRRRHVGRHCRQTADDRKLKSSSPCRRDRECRRMSPDISRQTSKGSLDTSAQGVIGRRMRPGWDRGSSFGRHQALWRGGCELRFVAAVGPSRVARYHPDLRSAQRCRSCH